MAAPATSSKRIRDLTQKSAGIFGWMNQAKSAQKSADPQATTRRKSRPTIVSWEYKPFSAPAPVSSRSRCMFVPPGLCMVHLGEDHNAQEERDLPHAIESVIDSTTRLAKSELPDTRNQPVAYGCG